MKHCWQGRFESIIYVFDLSYISIIYDFYFYVH